MCSFEGKLFARGCFPFLVVCIAARTTGQEPPKLEPPPLRKNNPAAVALGKLGASEGGMAGAESLSKSG